MMDPRQAMRLWMQMALVMTEAQLVITLRLMAMAGMWAPAAGENRRMVSEKMQAAAEAGARMGQAMLAGGSPAAVALAGVRPVRRRTRGNVVRLTRGAGK